MKKRIFLMMTALVASATMLFTGCQPNEEKIPALNLDETAIVAPNTGDTYEIDIKSNGKWTAEVVHNATWITLPTKSGENDGTLTIVVAASEVEEIQRDTVQVTLGTIVKRIPVELAAMDVEDPYLRVDASPINAPVAGDTYTIEVESNGDWTVVVDETEATWVTLEDETGSGDGAFKVKVAAYSGVQTRFTTVTISMGEGEDVISETIEVNQAANSLNLQLGKDKIEATKDGGTFPVGVTCNSTWTATIENGGTWATVTNGTGILNGEFQVVINSTTIVSTRTARVVVTAPGGSPIYLPITQTGIDGILRFEPVTSSVTVPAEAGDTPISIFSNVSWTTSSNGSWVGIAPYVGYSGTTAVKIRAQKNETGAERTATITLKPTMDNNNAPTVTLVVKQPAFVPTMDFGSAGIINVGKDGSSQSLTINSNVDWTLDNMAATWFRVNPTSGTGTQSVTLSVDINTTYEARSGMIFLAATDGSVASKALTIMQEAAVAPVMAFTTVSPVNVANTAGTTDLGITSNIDWSINSNASWATLSAGSGSNDGTITVTYTKNEVAETRTATITLSTADNVVAPKTLTITQDAAIIIDPNEGITLNGVTWATSNLEEVGVFAATIDAKGKFFQFNRAVAWANSGSVTGWNTTAQTLGDWEAANNPCPDGWRVPTVADFESLPAGQRRKDNNAFWYGPNNATATIADPQGCLYFPSTNQRTSGSAPSQSTANQNRGYYWTANGSISLGAYATSFYWTTATGSSTATISNGMDSKNYGYAIRCVKE